MSGRFYYKLTPILSRPLSLPSKNFFTKVFHLTNSPRKSLNSLNPTLNDVYSLKAVPSSDVAWPRCPGSFPPHPRFLIPYMLPLLRSFPVSFGLPSCDGLSILSGTSISVFVPIFLALPLAFVGAANTPLFTPSAYLVVLITPPTYRMTTSILFILPRTLTYLLTLLLALATLHFLLRLPPPSGRSVTDPLLTHLTSFLLYCKNGVPSPAYYVAIEIIRFSIGSSSVRYPLAPAASYLKKSGKPNTGSFLSPPLLPIEPLFVVSGELPVSLCMNALDFLLPLFISPPPPLLPPANLHTLLAQRASSLIPTPFRPHHLPLSSVPFSPTRCTFAHILLQTLTLEHEGHPHFHGPAPVSAVALPVHSLLGVIPSSSPLISQLFRFQHTFAHVPNCTLTFKPCACGAIHGYITTLLPLAKHSPIHIGDPPTHTSDFVLQFDGGAFRELKLGGAGVILWKHQHGALEHIDSLCIPLYPCADAAYAEASGAAVAIGPTTHFSAPPLESPPLPAPASPPDVPMTEVKHGPAIDTAKVGTPLSAATITSLRPIIHPSAEIDLHAGNSLPPCVLHLSIISLQRPSRASPPCSLYGVTSSRNLAVPHTTTFFLPPLSRTLRNRLWMNLWMNLWMSLPVAKKRPSSRSLCPPMLMFLLPLTIHSAYPLLKFQLMTLPSPPSLQLLSPPLPLTLWCSTSMCNSRTTLSNSALITFSTLMLHLL